jgi:peptide/nickel transport system permease protein
MLTFLLRRALTVFLPTLLGISILIFGLMHAIPGNFVDILIGVGVDITPEQIKAIEASYGLDKPVPVQYLYWLGNVLRGNLGRSLRTGDPVAQEILRRLPITAELTAFALLIALVVAIPLGIIAALRRNATVDVAARVGSLVGVSIPNFLMGTLLILFFSLYLKGLFPTTGFVPLREGLVPNLRSLFLPALSLGLAMTASVMRMMRSSLLEELGREYVTVARAKGLAEKAVILRHAVRNALIPVVTVVGIWIGYLLGGTVIVEELFSIPGLGRLALYAIYQRDYPLVQGTVLFVAFVFVAVNFATDILYSILDPRIRIAGEQQ